MEVSVGGKVLLIHSNQRSFILQSGMALFQGSSALFSYVTEMLRRSLG